MLIEFLLLFIFRTQIYIVVTELNININRLGYRIYKLNNFYL